MGRSGCPTKGENRGLSLQVQKCELSPSELPLPSHLKIESPHLSPDHRPHIEKKVSLIAFRQILPKILSVACIFS